MKFFFDNSFQKAFDIASFYYLLFIIYIHYFIWDHGSHPLKETDFVVLFIVYIQSDFVMLFIVYIQSDFVVLFIVYIQSDFVMLFVVYSMLKMLLKVY